MPTDDHRRATMVDWESEHLAFRTIWQAAHTLRGTDAVDRSRRFPSRMGAAVLAHAAYEGFMNEALERLFPDVWRQEKTFFRSGRFQGWLGKTLFLAHELGVSLKREKRPYRTVAELNKWRNDLVHSRAVRGAGVCRSDAYAKRPTAERPVAFEKLKPAFVERCFHDVASLADMLLAAAQARRRTGLSHLGGKAFWGPAVSGGAALRE
jgi:hypothetical protein